MKEDKKTQIMELLKEDHFDVKMKEEEKIDKDKLWCLLETGACKYWVDEFHQSDGNNAMKVLVLVWRRRMAAPIWMYKQDFMLMSSHMQELLYVRF